MDNFKKEECNFSISLCTFLASFLKNGSSVITFDLFTYIGILIVNITRKYDNLLVSIYLAFNCVILSAYNHRLFKYLFLSYSNFFLNLFKTLFLRIMKSFSSIFFCRNLLSVVKKILFFLFIFFIFSICKVLF